ncbi:MAG: hypothetical protein ACFCVG_17880 [Kineosporiaceae bacterium]
MLPDPTDPRGRCEVETARVVARLTALGPHRVPRVSMAGACRELAHLAWRAGSRPGDPPAVDVAPHGWVDVVRVLAGDLLEVTPEPPELAVAADALARLRRELP